jgi:hypothetical protein
VPAFFYTEATRCPSACRGRNRVALPALSLRRRTSCRCLPFLRGDGSWSLVLRSRWPWRRPYTEETDVACPDTEETDAA